MGKTIAVVGTAQSSNKQANNEPPEVERWAIGSARFWLSQVDRFFEVHTREHLQRRARTAYFQHLQWMQEFNGPVYMLEVDPNIPNAVAMPIEEMTKKFFPFGEHPYFTSSVSYMLALAIMEEPDEIKLFGIDFATKEERTHQRAGTEYFIGWAAGAGIRVTVPATSPIMKGALYGARRDYKVNQDTLQERLRKQETDEQRLANGLVAVRARLQEVELAMQAERSTYRKRKMRDRMREIRAEEVVAQEQLITHRGAVMENERWVNEEIGLESAMSIPASAVPVAIDLARLAQIKNGGKAKVKA